MLDEITGFSANPLVELEFTGVQRAQINAVFQHWFAATNKRAVPNLGDLVKQFSIKMSKLAQVIRLKYVFNGSKDADLVAYAVGDDADTLQRMRLGTLWFDGWKNLEYEVLIAATDSSGTLTRVAKTLGSTYNTAR